jgi:prepilin-type N-terminal cleavage/methylation domain-containing protein
MEKFTAASSHRNAGFTLLELAVAMVVFSVVMYGGFQLFQSVTKETSKAQKAIETNLGGLVAERVVRNDIVDAGASLNNLKLLDNNTKSFFDFRPDWPCAADCSRVLSISNRAADKKEFMILAHDEGLLSPQMYPPVAAYQATPNATLDVAGTLTFKGINYNDSLKKIIKPADYPSFWSASKTPRLLLFYSPVPSRPIIAGVVNMATPPRSTMYLGKLEYNMSGVNPTNVKITATNMSGNVNNEHPMRPGVWMNDTSDAFGKDGFDRFLRTLPPVGGVGAVALFRPVRMVRYVMKVGPPPKSPNELWRYDWDTATNAWTTKPSLVGSDIFGVVLNRRSISSPIIDYVVARDEAAYKRALKP